MGGFDAARGHASPSAAPLEHGVTRDDCANHPRAESQSRAESSAVLPPPQAAFVQSAGLA